MDMDTLPAAVEMVTCSACGASNRVTSTRLAQGQPKCGRCMLPLTEGTAVAVTDRTFAARVEASELPVLIDVWAPWCGPCQQIAPVIDQLASELSGRVRVVKLNVDENPRTAERFQIRSIPTLLVLRAGREIARIQGSRSKGEILRQLERLIAH